MSFCICDLSVKLKNHFIVKRTSTLTTKLTSSENISPQSMCYTQLFSTRDYEMSLYHSYLGFLNLIWSDAVIPTEPLAEDKQSKVSVYTYTLSIYHWECTFYGLTLIIRNRRQSYLRY